MLGAICGDVVGSVYEWHNIKTKEFELFKDKCFFTDDSVMTVAIAEACYGITDDVKEKTISYLTDDLKEVVEELR